jgi:hypothetical protein
MSDKYTEISDALGWKVVDKPERQEDEYEATCQQTMQTLLEALPDGARASELRDHAVYAGADCPLSVLTVSRIDVRFDPFSVPLDVALRIIKAVCEERDDAIAAQRDVLLEACQTFVAAWTKSGQFEKTDVALRTAKAAIELCEKTSEKS